MVSNPVVCLFVCVSFCLQSSPPSPPKAFSTELSFKNVNQIVLSPFNCFPSMKYLIVSLWGPVGLGFYFSLQTYSFGHSSVFLTLAQLHCPSHNSWNTPNSSPTSETLLRLFFDLPYFSLYRHHTLHGSACHHAREAFSDSPCLESVSYILYYRTIVPLFLILWLEDILYSPPTRL